MNKNIKKNVQKSSIFSFQFIRALFGVIYDVTIVLNATFCCDLRRLLLPSLPYLHTFVYFRLYSVSICREREWSWSIQNVLLVSLCLKCKTIQFIFYSLLYYYCYKRLCMLLSICPCVLFWSYLYFQSWFHYCH